MSERATDSILVCQVEGLCCASEAGPLERALQSLAGVRQVVADPALARLTVTYDQRALPATRIVHEVARLGFRATPGGAVPGALDQQPPIDAHLSESPSAIEHWWSVVWGHPRNGLAALCGILLLAAWLGGFLGLPEQFTALLYAGATLVGGVPVARSGWARLRAARVLDMNALMTIAAVGALLIGEYAEGATVVFLFALGNALEDSAMARVRRSIQALMRLAPDTARTLRDGAERVVPAAEVRVGEVVLVRPGDRIPLDGVVLAGSSEVDQAPITGESVPLAKAPGAEVFAGTINGEGALDVRVTRPAQESLLARIIHLVEQAQARKARAQRFVESFAVFYTPAVLLLAGVVAVMPPLVVGGAWSEWFYRALVLLVIACPCALVLSTPVSIVSAISAAARGGVLFKGGAALEATGRLRAIAFDKTGTLTRGQPVVTDVVALESAPDPSALTPAGELLALAAAVERRSAHPLARAIVSAAEERGLPIAPASDFRSANGAGAVAWVDGREVTVGSRRMFTPELPHPIAARLDDLEQSGRTAMLVGYDGAPRGIIAASDVVRPESRAVVAALKELGVGRIAMLTGDATPVAGRVAADVGIDEARAGLLPHQKLAAIDELLARHEHVGMVGDGVNDAPALARASVGIAMGAAGSDAALETADVALMTDDLSRLPFAIGLSRATRRVIIQNVAFALIVKAAFLVAALLGSATLWMAVFADTGATLIVIANGMRLLRYRTP